MMKRFTIFYLILCLLAPSIIAHADVVMGNDFYWENRDKVQALERWTFVANGPDGYIIPQEKPGEAKTTFKNPWSEDEEVVDLPTYENGTPISLRGTYIYNNEYWGIMTYGHHAVLPGWIPMKDLLAVYTADDFIRENEAEFHTYSGSTDFLTQAGQVVIWQWPGSDREKRVMNAENPLVANMKVIKTYQDTAGREWGYFTVESGYPSSGWICLSEPSNGKIPPFYPAPKPTKWSPDGNLEWEHAAKPNEPYEQNLLSNICKVKTYDSPFPDVPSNMWYHDAVKLAYEYGILEGNYDGKFYPDENMTVCEATIIAAQIHAYYKYGKEEGKRWLEIYNNAYNYGSRYDNLAGVYYCEAEGIIKAGEFDDYNALLDPITRAQLAHIGAKILESKDMAKQNTVTSLPDVNEDTDYSADILLFYEAGIVGGVDAKGSFHPNDVVTRAQGAAIFTNLIDVSRRYSGRSYGN